MSIEKAVVSRRRVSDNLAMTDPCECGPTCRTNTRHLHAFLDTPFLQLGA